MSGRLVTLRSACPDDVEALAKIHSACFHKSWNKEAFVKLLEQPVYSAWLVEQENQIAAFIVVMAAGEALEIITIATHPKFQRKGLAKLLLLYVDKDLEGQDIQNWFLEVSEENHSAICFYKKMGFAKQGIRRNYYKLEDGKCADALIYTAKLGQLDS